MAFITSVVVARFITPTELGHYALAGTIVTLVGAASSLQAGGYYVIADDPSPRLLRTGLTLELGLSATLWLLVVIGSCLWGSIGGDWTVPALLIGASTVLLINPFNSLRSWYARRLDFKVPATALIIASAITMAIKIGLVVAGFGAWALVIGDIALTAVYGAAMLITIPDARGFALDRALAKRQIDFGLPSLGIGLLNMGSQRAPDLIIAAMLGPAALGFYFLAARIPAQLYLLFVAIANALFPAYSRANPSQLKYAFNNVSYFAGMMFVVPLAILVPFTTWIITTVYGSKWEEAAIPSAILFTVTAVRFVMWQYGNLLKSQNRQRLVLWISTYTITLTVVACLVGVSLGGLVGATLGLLVVELALIPAKLKVIRSVVEFHAVRMIGPALLALAASLAVAYGLAGVLADPVAIALTAIASGAITLGAIYMTNRHAALRIVGAIMPGKHGPAA